MGEFNSDDHYIYYCGEESIRRNGVAIMVNFSFFSITGWGIDLDYCDIEWFALETNRDHSVIFFYYYYYYTQVLHFVLFC